MILTCAHSSRNVQLPACLCPKSPNGIYPHKLLLVMEKYIFKAAHKGWTSKAANRISCCFITLSLNQCHHMLLLAQDSPQWLPGRQQALSKWVRIIWLFENNSPAFCFVQPLACVGIYIIIQLLQHVINSDILYIRYILWKKNHLMLPCTIFYIFLCISLITAKYNLYFVLLAAYMQSIKCMKTNKGSNNS